MIFGKTENIATLDDVFRTSRRALRNGVRNARHLFHRPILATMDGNKPQVRTVILRGFSEKDRTLICNCNTRTIARNPRISVRLLENP